MLCPTYLNIVYRSSSVLAISSHFPNCTRLRSPSLVLSRPASPPFRSNPLAYASIVPPRHLERITSSHAHVFHTSYPPTLLLSLVGHPTIQTAGGWGQADNGGSWGGVSNLFRRSYLRKQPLSQPSTLTRLPVHPLQNAGGYSGGYGQRSNACYNCGQGESSAIRLGLLPTPPDLVRLFR